MQFELLIFLHVLSTNKNGRDCQRGFKWCQRYQDPLALVANYNQTLSLVEAACSMLIFSKAPLFLWAEAVATACYTQNQSLIRKRHNKTPYELLYNKKPDLSYLHVFGALCYPTNDSEDLGKLQPKADIGIFARPGPQLMNHATHSSRLVPNPPSPTPSVPPAKKDWEILFQPIFYEYFSPPTSVASLVHTAVALVPADSYSIPSSTLVDQDAPSPNLRKKKIVRGKVYNWETATYGKIWYNEDVHDHRSIETEFPAIVLNDALTSEVTLCEPTLNPLNDNKINFRISFDEYDDEDYTDNDDDKIDIEHSSRDLSVKPLPNVINTDDGAYAHGYQYDVSWGMDTAYRLPVQF
ncbi:retrovirus-related pol polyprotein from transposon TNT 1-94 [Tanacetum coccineum]|uniref:Retrovirus-related pol polyprotein from transposon TNT 1-94 n=1 Tax=Tanacetum coccineum TaxID=301880 RepID=A0ABQ4ZLH8_9ASTR